MPILLGLAAIIAGLLFWLYRLNHAVDTVRDLDGKTQGLQRQARNFGLALFGTRLQRVDDPRLAATILMLQLVRTGAPVTASEKTQIMEIMETELHVTKIEAMFVRAWSYTDQNRVFSPIADELLPLLRDKLMPSERRDLLAMLTKVANAFGEASELQRQAIARLGHLLAVSPALARVETVQGDDGGLRS